MIMDVSIYVLIFKLYRYRLLISNQYFVNTNVVHCVVIFETWRIIIHIRIVYHTYLNINLKLNIVFECSFCSYVENCLQRTLKYIVYNVLLQDTGTLVYQ